MNKIQDEIRKVAIAAFDAWCDSEDSENWHIASRGIISERDRCLSILKSIEPMNPSEAHLIETIVRRIRGEE